MSSERLFGVTIFDNCLLWEVWTAFPRVWVPWPEQGLGHPIGNDRRRRTMGGHGHHRDLQVTSTLL